MYAEMKCNPCNQNNVKLPLRPAGDPQVDGGEAQRRRRRLEVREI